MSGKSAIFGTSLTRSTTGLGNTDLNGEVTVLQGSNVLFFCTMEYDLGLSDGDRNDEMTLQER